MSNPFAWVSAALPPPPPPPLLSDEVRRKLHLLGWTTIRQSNLYTARLCPYKQALAVRQETYDSYSIFAVLGIVCHRAAQVLVQGREFEPAHTADWWLDHYRAWVREEKPKEIRLRGTVLSKDQVRQIVSRLGEPRLAGRYMADVLEGCFTPMWDMGMVPVSIEHQYVYVDGAGSKYPIRFQGTIDLLTRMFDGTLVLWDLKFFGLLGAYLDEPESFKKQSMEQSLIQFSTQHRHYSWMMSKVGLPLPHYYGFVFPVNQVPYQKSGAGYVKGSPRGPGITIPAHVPTQLYINQWERDLVEFLTSWTHYRPKHYADCHSCAYLRWCLKNPGADVVANDSQLDYLRE